MSSFWIPLIKVSIYFLFATGENSEKLFNVATTSQSSDQSGELSRTYEDGDAVLILNHHLNEDESSDDLNDFEPVKQMANRFSDCVIWESKTCLVSWRNRTYWTVVSSLEEPIGPVVDYRWKGFDEYILSNVTGGKKYHNVLQINSLDGTVIFSIQGTRDIQICICDENSPSSPCIVIKIAVGGTHSVIETCLNYVSSNGHRMVNKTCVEIDNVKHDTAILNAYEWRTFRLQWITKERKIKLFQDTAKEAFLQGQVRQWYPVRNFSVESVAQARIRFHDYYYYLTTLNNSLLTTAKMNYRVKNFCLNMLVSLCPNCRLNVSLINDENGSAMAHTSISGNTNSRSNGLGIWQSITLEIILQETLSISIKLQIISVLDKDDRGDVWWAIDDVRVCERTDGIRKSSIAVPISYMSNDMPEIGCKKLLHCEIVVANLSPSESYNYIRQSRKFVSERRKPCPPGCTTFRKVKGNAHGCRCYRDNSEDNGTGKSCLDIVLKYTNISAQSSERMPCSAIPSDFVLEVFEEPVNESLGRQVCPLLPCIYTSELESWTNYTVKVTTQNGIIFKKQIYTHELAPKMILPLTIKSVFANNVTGEWKLETGNRNQPPTLRINKTFDNIVYSVAIQRIALLGCENLKKESPVESEKRQNVSKTTATFTGLHPYARYNFTVTTNTVEPRPLIWKVFETLPLDIPTSKITNFHRVNESYLAWDPPEDCTTIRGPVNMTRLIFLDLNNRMSNFSRSYIDYQGSDLKSISLLPYTWYEARAYVIRGSNKPVNDSYFQELNFTTPPAAPPAVKEFDIYEADAIKTTISLRWIPPHPANGQIQFYQVSLIDGDTYIKNRSIKASELKRCTSAYVCVEHLSLPPNTSINANLSLQIFAKNEKVAENGSTILRTFYLDGLYNKKPDQPQNLTAIPESRNGVMTLKWVHPPLTPTKILRFRIRAEFLQTNLLMNPFEKNRTIYYNVTEVKKTYSTELTLLTSTDYRIRLVAMNYRNKTSSAVIKNITVPANLTFASNNKLWTESNETAIKLQVPAVVGGTKNTTVVIKMKGFSMCQKKSSGNILPSTNEPSSTSEWVAAEYLLNSSEPVYLTFDTSQYYGVTLNCSFSVQENYHFKVTVTDWYSMKKYFLTSDIVNFKLSKDLFGDWFLIILFLTMLIICLLLLFTYHWKCRKAEMKSSNLYDLPLVRLNSSKSSLDATDHPYSTQKNESDVEICDPHSHPMKIEELEEFVKEALASRLLVSHWKMLPRVFLRPCKYGYLPKNKPKNQCDHVIPYNDNRVVLKKVSNDSNSDYINASYIQGYLKANAYIATQGPKRDKTTNTDTVPDFWRMVSQENVHVICMLTNVIENGQRKCEQYWPDVGESAEYGEVFVLNIENLISVDYTIRTFQLIYRGNKREIKHFHYTGWPERGVPMFTQSLAAFMRKLLAAPVGEGPMIVHGSVGVGRTGTLILCDICLRQAAEETVINIPAVTLKMRQERVNMVDTVQQYLLAHLVIVECQILEKTQIPCNDRLKERIEELRGMLPSDMQRLNDIAWQDKALLSLAYRPSTIDDTLPNKLWYSGRANPSLAESSIPAMLKNQSSCLPTVSVEGFKRKGQFLATKQPSAFTLPDLGNLLAERKIELIVVLQFPDPEDSVSAMIKYENIPNEPSSRPRSNIILQGRVKLAKTKYFTTERLDLIYTSQVDEDIQRVTIFTCTEWTNKTLPPVEALVSLWIASEKIKRKENPTLVICRDGVTGCGLYLALSCLLEQMFLDRECDVISAVRTIRRSSPDFLQSSEQVEYLYEAAINYNARFATYAEVP